MSKKKKRLSVSQRLFNEGKDFFLRYENDVTRKCYTRNFKRFIEYCRNVHNVQSMDDCKEYIQDYIIYLKDEKHFTPSTIHTYAMPACLYFGVSIKNYTKPKRRTAEYIRGRSDNGRLEHSGNDFTNPRYAEIVAFQQKAGLRRAELKRLKGADLTVDESGYPAIRVRGKGGKMQLQRVLDIHFVKAYFQNKAPDEKIFSPRHFKNTLNFHALRAQCAQEAYKYYENRLKTEGEPYRRQLEAEVRKRLIATNIDKKTGKPKKIKQQYLHGKYFCRGKNKELCKRLGKPWVYDMLAVQAVSIFHLAHNRPGVTVQSYLLAY